MKGAEKHVKSNHLGNVLAVVSDVKIPVDETEDGDVDFWVSDVISATDYSPFGVRLIERNFNTSKYRYSFQNQEHDDEVSGGGNSVNYTYRMQDTRLGRFKSIDPLVNDYPWNSPFAFSENTVISHIELEGKEKLEAFIGGTITTPQLNVPVAISIKYDFNTNMYTFAITTFDKDSGPISSIIIYDENSGTYTISISDLPIPRKFFDDPNDATEYPSWAVALGMAFTDAGENIEEFLIDYPEIGEAIFGEVRGADDKDRAVKTVDKFIKSIEEGKIKVLDVGKAEDEIKRIDGENVTFEGGDIIRVKTTKKSVGTFNFEGTDVNIEGVVIDYTEQTETEQN